MLTQSEIKLLRPGKSAFLFNALNTIKAVIRRDSEQASQLVSVSSTFFRKTLKRPSEFVTLADEIEHVNAYLQLKRHAFSRGCRSTLLFRKNFRQHLPAFTLQPIVENAIKHGTSQLLDIWGEWQSVPAVKGNILCWILKTTLDYTNRQPMPAGLG